MKLVGVDKTLKIEINSVVLKKYLTALDNIIKIDASKPDVDENMVKVEEFYLELIKIFDDINNW